MTKKLTILVLFFFVSSIALGATDPKKNHCIPLRDGFALAGADGKLTTADSNGAPDRWFFEFDSELTDGRGEIKAGQSVELLASSTLEKLTIDAESRSVKNYRLSGRITQYDGKNFIFPDYFLPLGKEDAHQPSMSVELQGQNARPPINEPNDMVTIPEEILSKLTTRKIIRTKQPAPTVELKPDSILADRTALLVKQADGRFVFVLDAIGRNLATASFPVLPCQVLQQAQRIQAEQLEPVRFKIAAIVTKYKGREYLLLLRAIRVYSYGNFPR